MTWIRKTIIFVGLLMLFLSAYNADKVVIDIIQPQKTDSNITPDSIKTSAFIQPQASFHVVADLKTNYPSPSLSKWFDTFLIVIPDYKIQRITFNFADQIINQRKKISILLYPFHYFW
ncbi:hypothetical protein OIU80_06110 [Flavobacterium sp. LS1R47]|jgi:hypothetical protein|uniref:Uncharacterized protein n=1 Tax=Flavobacterium frigoritolerans TaxID=2987686 RepID=A0A9X2ZQA9_9FLAO|nr:hypothetical protein [Flavobacterium frigoritolerans]MCV9931853.1 hypothetical protein [Flavobacterium frigoritolerans]